VSVLLGNGDGSFQTPFSLGVASEPKQVVSADFNADGKADIAVLCQPVLNSDANTVTLLLGNGDGTLKAGQTYSATPNGTAGPASLAAGALSATGKTNLMVTWNNSYLSILTGLGNGNFQSISNDYTGLAGALGDFNNDGVLDLVTTTGRDLYVQFGNGRGSWSKPTGTLLSEAPNAVATGDFNSDGKLDVAFSSTSNSDLSVALGNGNGTFQTPTNYHAGSSPVGVQTGDFNGDGKLDVAVADHQGGGVDILLGNGDGTLQAFTVYGNTCLNNALAVGDLNGDGKLDIVTNGAGSGTTGICVLLGNGNGTFQPVVTYNTGTGPNAISIADVNNDGKMDVVTFNSGSYSVLLGNGDGTLQAAKTTNAGSGSLWGAVAKIDSDSYPDLVISSSQSDTVMLLYGRGDGTFKSPVNYAAAGSPGTVFLGDLRNGGHNDAVITETNTNSASVFLNAQ
jgi:hypothetical protein